MVTSLHPADRMECTNEARLHDMKSELASLAAEFGKEPCAFWREDVSVPKHGFSISNAVPARTSQPARRSLSFSLSLSLSLSLSPSLSLSLSLARNTSPRE
ncbi:hypothetical protein B0A54_16337 [Friedmanniomyces endolithicus]|uniref:Uncharacterized protein n=1 Tax=Friedmanniomyces endolithicus TaxID=329885 RepID=A0A4U0U2R0_9PEZI|nr:hypothetical protein B0A54_16337 [Friedmanniomyces endolithicus]